jgi:hypothetical protein
MASHAIPYSRRPALRMVQSGNFDDDLPQCLDVGQQLLISGRQAIELNKISDDVDIGLIVKAAPRVGRHRAADLLEPVRECLALPGELECTIAEVRRFGLSAMEIGAMATRALCLKDTFSIFLPARPRTHRSTWSVAAAGRARYPLQEAEPER